MSWNWHRGLIFTYFQWQAMKKMIEGQNRSNLQHINSIYMCSRGFNRNNITITYAQVDSVLHQKYCFVRTNREEGEVFDQGRLNNAPHKANPVEQKQSISNLQSWQITTCAAKRFSPVGGMLSIFQDDTTRKLFCKQRNAISKLFGSS